MDINTIVLTQSQEDIILSSMSYFEAFGTELSADNGKALPIDKSEVDINRQWSIDVYVLTINGLTRAYYRHELLTYTVVGFAPFDIKIEHAPILSDKFITQEQFKELREILKPNQ